MNKAMAIELIENAARDAKGPTLLNYAAAYAREARNMVGEEWRVQALYILSNLSHWRGDNAKSVKEFLKQEARWKSA